MAIPLSSTHKVGQDFIKTNKMKVYPHILLRKGDKIKPGGDEKMWHVVDLVDGNLIATDGVHIFSPPWGFYLKERDYYIPITQVVPEAK